jgi:hypothetical protein
VIVGTRGEYALAVEIGKLALDLAWKYGTNIEKGYAESTKFHSSC